MTKALFDLQLHCKNLSDKEFFELLLQSVESRVVKGVTFPAFPDSQLQANFVGSAGKDALSEAYQFWRLLKSKASAVQRPLGETSNVLDFGCGWGRYLRFLNKDIRAEHLYGVDVNPEIINLCRKLDVPGNLTVIDPVGRLQFPDDFFDIVLAYSVFTHLPEDVHLHWMQEITRVSRHGAVCAMTLEPRRFIQFVRVEAPKGKSGWHQGLARFAPIANKLLVQFDAGGFVYLPTGGGAYLPSSIYGDAVVPLTWIARNWNGWTVNDYIDDGARFWQAVLVLQKS